MLVLPIVAYYIVVLVLPVLPGSAVKISWIKLQASKWEAM